MWLRWSWNWSETSGRSWTASPKTTSTPSCSFYEQTKYIHVYKNFSSRHVWLFHSSLYWSDKINTRTSFFHQNKKTKIVNMIIISQIWILSISLYIVFYKTLKWLNYCRQEKQVNYKSIEQLMINIMTSDAHSVFLFFICIETNHFSHILSRIEHCSCHKCKNLATVELNVLSNVIKRELILSISSFCT